MELAIAHETIARWQFGMTTVYHFLFVPLSIGLGIIVAGLETAWVRTGKVKYFHATKFWGKLLLINIAMGVVTGIMQEFQFGMNWSDYSRFVGDVFGAPLAMEALIAFFFESTFIGLWIFGWHRLPKKLHLACIYMVTIGSILSAYFILAANSFMQHPVGYRIDPSTRKAQLTDIWAVLFQDTTLVVVFHTLTAAFLTGAAFVMGIAAYHLWRAKRGKDTNRQRISAMRSSLRCALVIAVVAGILTALSGDRLSKVMFEQQPMKMAAAEALWETQAPAPFSIFSVGDVGTGRNLIALEVPAALSFLAKSDFSSPVPGINTRAEEQVRQFGGTREEYIPDIFMTYWGFRLMIFFGMTSFGIGLLGLWLTRKKFWLDPSYRTGDDEPPTLMLTNKIAMNTFFTKWSWRIAALTLAFPLVANSFGWIFTEMGRQPWVVFHLQTTTDAVSPNVSMAEQITSLVAFSVLYAILAVVEVGLLIKYAKPGPDVDEQPPAKDPTLRPSAEDADKPLAFAY
ncbi:MULTISPECIES: cytochrome ubiquinol oxidase subunit I [Streptomyces]|uniref:Cytochrome ubiquinol oxidase subunit I n=1 Tax=Streptomyces dengpaensis TaxID=2049881 RepID=A0ABN5HW82_9ACTN|nr:MULTISPECIES: cytochrome ubiquinol oxidase subunit I [Streptomyces]AVH54860.1 cytochrome ubiquinol oxidase subunit I [Streptomyces dengpaensis]PIB03286.1 cytochrome ubiquinol oxidase subunit I [Streptomyces sp. HG99]